MDLFSDVYYPYSVKLITIDNHLLAEDGVGGREGSFSMCTFWLVEALTRAGKYDKSFIAQAVLMFEDMISYSNHLGLYSEEITRSGEVFILQTYADVLVSREFSASIHAYGLYQCSVQSESCTSVVRRNFKSRKVAILLCGLEMIYILCLS